MAAANDLEVHDRFSVKSDSGSLNVTDVKVLSDDSLTAWPTHQTIPSSNTKKRKLAITK